MQTPTQTVIVGDCRDVLRTMAAESIDAVVTDPPYDLTTGTGRGFMGKSWDGTGVAFDAATWSAAYRVLKPGAHLLAFGGDRTIHRMVCAIEDAGFEIRGQLAWAHAQGFPKNLNVSNALREQLPELLRCACDPHSTQTVEDSPTDYQDRHHSGDEPLPSLLGVSQDETPSQGDALVHIRGDQRADDLASSQANTSLDADSGHLSNECSHRRALPLSKGSQANGNTPSGMASNTSSDEQTATHKTATRILRTSHSVVDSVSSSSLPPHSVHPYITHCTTCGGHRVADGLGTALKPAMELICLARKPLAKGHTIAANVARYSTGGLNIDASRIGTGGQLKWEQPRDMGYHGGSDAGTVDATANTLGRWPANLLLDSEAGALLDTMSGERSAGGRPSKRGGMGYHGGNGTNDGERITFDTGGASRFFARLDFAEGEQEAVSRLAYHPKASRRERNAGLGGPDGVSVNAHPT